MTVIKGDVYADRDNRRKGREVKVLHVEDGFATVKVISSASSALKSSIGKTTDIRLDRLTKEYDYVGTLEADIPELQPIVGFEGDPNVVGIFENPGLSEEYKANLLAQYGHTSLATWDDEDDYSDEYLNYSDDEEAHGATDFPEDDEYIEDEVDLEDALSMAGYFWLPPEDALVESMLPVIEGVDLRQEDLIRMVHQSIRGLRV